MGAKETTRQTRTVQSLDRGITGLELAFEGPVKPADLARTLGIDRSSAYRLLYTWAKRGYLTRDTHAGTFTPNGAKFAALHARVARTSRWTDPALASLKKLRDKTGETANLGVLDDHHVVFLGQELAQTSVIIIDLLGRHRPAHCSALGKAILAFLPREQLRQWLQREPLPASTFRSITDPDALELHLSGIRENGYALDDEETNEGVRCVAAPLFDSFGAVVGAIGISGPISRITVSRIPDLAKTVREVAMQTSAHLGYIAGSDPTDSEVSQHKTGRL